MKAVAKDGCEIRLASQWRLFMLPDDRWFRIADPDGGFASQRHLLEPAASRCSISTGTR
ncbi:hypothetical protein SAMN05216228_1021105 [Rhizobium tibeticum]|uniref:Uncharacterized protein n=1 Tax=Rhizobium tibeticum TaxID=501024 RepID=A0A1H8RHH5_9HYPH|nr:hypothetical protein [Rhizobium tibeticum]SEI06924.1 hypothetical protein RTCCBAU85039_4180 [Rhizobium tibeticum]SEO65618.1 hypothetical protein SAMN05216228_1021105 [Rhizobium tibeticum]